MTVSKVMNNNVVSALDDKQKEVIVLGKGVGFQKKEGDLIDETKVEKIFRLPRQYENEFDRLVSEMPYEFVTYTDDIVKSATLKLGKKLSKNIYITLTDHIYFAIERLREGLEISNAMLYEIKRFYNPEYQIGLEAIANIGRKEDIELPVDEAGFIALHIVNAELNLSMMSTMSIPKVLKDVTNIVRLSLLAQVDEDSLEYERFIVHLKYMLQRAADHVVYKDENEEFVRFYRRFEPECYDCACKIIKYVKEKFKYDIPREEELYLTMHLSRLRK